MAVPGLPMSIVTEAHAAVDANVETVSIDGKLYHVKTSYIQYKVKAGDNLYSLANKHNCTVKELMAWNGLRDSRLAIGQRLEIRRETRELVPVVLEVPQPLRPSITIADLPSRELNIAERIGQQANFNFSIKPQVNETSGDAFVLKRRQCLRQVLSTESFDASQVIMPENVATGDVVRVKVKA